MTGLPTRGEVWWSESPQYPRRPVVVMSRDRVISALRRPLVAPCTTRIRGLATEVELHPDLDPVVRPCVVALDSVESVSVGFLTERIGTLDSARMTQICRALAIATGCSG
jgi:mRNA interferase MazF